MKREFTSLLREACKGAPLETAGAAVSNGRRRTQESAEAVVPRVTSREHPDGLTTREGLNLAGRTRPSVVLTRSDEADRLSIWAAIIVAEKEWLLRPLRTARNRRTRTRMYGGVGGRVRIPPADPIRPGVVLPVAAVN